MSNSSKNLPSQSKTRKEARGYKINNGNRFALNISFGLLAIMHGSFYQTLPQGTQPRGLGLFTYKTGSTFHSDTQSLTHRNGWHQFLMSPRAPKVLPTSFSCRRAPSPFPLLSLSQIPEDLPHPASQGITANPFHPEADSEVSPGLERRHSPGAGPGAAAARTATGRGDSC